MRAYKLSSAFESRVVAHELKALSASEMETAGLARCEVAAAPALSLEALRPFPLLYVEGTQGCNAPGSKVALLSSCAVRTLSRGSV